GRANGCSAGGAGDDIIIGGAADDTLSGEDGNDLIDGGAGDDLSRGHRRKDLLNGGACDDIIDGGADDDELRGGDGNDVLIGGAGDDRIDGGAGTDIVTRPGSYGDYRLAKTPTGVWIADTRPGHDGTDFVSNVEFVDFANIQHLDLNASMPMAVKDVVTVSGPGPFIITTAQLFANDLNYPNDTLSLKSVSDATGGSVTTQHGNIQFTPDPSFTGVMSFTYSVQNSAA